MEITLKGYIEKSEFWKKVKNDRCKSGEAGEPQYCPFCGKEKETFINPVAEVWHLPNIELVPCECEKYFKMLNDFLEVNFEWLSWPNRPVLKVPDYAKAENKEERQHSQHEFVILVKKSRDEMSDKREKLKWQIEQSNLRG